MSWGIVWYIDFADQSVISSCIKAIQTCVKFLSWIRNFTQYVLMKSMANQNFAKTAGFCLAGHVFVAHIFYPMYFDGT